MAITEARKTEIIKRAQEYAELEGLEIRARAELSDALPGEVRGWKENISEIHDAKYDLLRGLGEDRVIVVKLAKQWYELNDRERAGYEGQILSLASFNEKGELVNEKGQPELPERVLRSIEKEANHDVLKISGTYQTRVGKSDKFTTQATSRVNALWEYYFEEEKAIFQEKDASIIEARKKALQAEKDKVYEEFSGPFKEDLMKAMIKDRELGGDGKYFEEALIKDINNGSRKEFYQFIHQMVIRDYLDEKFENKAKSYIYENGVLYQQGKRGKKGEEYLRLTDANKHLFGLSADQDISQLSHEEVETRMRTYAKHILTEKFNEKFKDGVLFCEKGNGIVYSKELEKLLTKDEIKLIEGRFGVRWEDCCRHAEMQLRNEIEEANKENDGETNEGGENPEEEKPEVKERERTEREKKFRGYDAPNAATVNIAERVMRSREKYLTHDMQIEVCDLYFKKMEKYRNKMDKDLEKEMKRIRKGEQKAERKAEKVKSKSTKLYEEICQEAEFGAMDKDLVKEKSKKDGKFSKFIKERLEKIKENQHERKVEKDKQFVEEREGEEGEQEGEQEEVEEVVETPETPESSEATIDQKIKSIEEQRKAGVYDSVFSTAGVKVEKYLREEAQAEEEAEGAEVDEAEAVDEVEAAEVDEAEAETKGKPGLGDKIREGVKKVTEKVADTVAGKTKEKIGEFEIDLGIDDTAAIGIGSTYAGRYVTDTNVSDNASEQQEEREVNEEAPAVEVTADEINNYVNAVYSEVEFGFFGSDEEKIVIPKEIEEAAGRVGLLPEDLFREVVEREAREAKAEGYTEENFLQFKRERDAEILREAVAHGSTETVDEIKLNFAIEQAQNIKAEMEARVNGENISETDDPTSGM